MDDGAFSEESGCEIGDRNAIYIVLFSDQAILENVEAAQEEDGWEKVGNGVKEGGQQEENAAPELFSEGSTAFEDGDYVRAVDRLRRSLKIRLGFFLSTCRTYPKS